jgi:itaconyl-CoA hydratase
MATEEIHTYCPMCIAKCGVVAAVEDGRFTKVTPDSEHPNALLTMNIQQVHFDAAYAAKTEWKKPLVDSTFTLALLTGMSVRTVSAKVVANLGWDKVKATHPVFAGDTLYAESTVLHKRESKSRPTQGIVTVLTRGVNQEGIEVMSFERTMLVHRRGHSPEEAAN